MYLKSSLSVSVLLALSCSALAEGPANPRTTSDIEAATGQARQGWYFYMDPEKRREAEKQLEAQAKAPSQPNPTNPQKDCKKPEEWEPSCGFVNPGNDFAFQAKQRDALMQRFAMEASNPKSVEDYQRYQSWVTDQAITASNVWVWNQVQNSDLDPAATAPISSLGLTLAAKAKSSAAHELMDVVNKAGGRMLFFTRTDCDWCHTQKSLLMAETQRQKLKVWNVTLDKECLPGFETTCIKGPLALALARELKVQIVPSLVLFIPDNTWIKIASGFVTESAIQGRLSNFLAAYKGAIQESSLSDAPVKPDFSQMLRPASGTKTVE